MNDELRGYFATEARELVEQLTLAAMHLERAGTLDAAQRRHVLRLAHTLKGSARIVGAGQVAAAAHAIEDLVSAAGETPDPSMARALLAQVDGISAALALPTEGPDVAVAPPAEGMPGAPASPASAAEEPNRVARVELSAIDRALEHLAETTTRTRGLLLRAMSVGAGGGLASAVERVLADLAELRTQLHGMRLAPARVLFTPVERAVRDAAVASGVQVRFEATGGDHRVDADVLASVRDALIQIARNAVAHGVEPPAVRVGARKPPQGLVTLAVERRGDRIAFVVGDDGRGLDLPRLRQAARDAGLPVGSGRQTDDEQLVSLLLAGGLSSRGEVSQISGRGVGLDVVRTVASRYGGTVDLRNQPGVGLTVTLLLPVILRSVRYLRVESGRHAALLPLEAVRRTARSTDLARVVTADGVQVVVDNQPVPHLSLWRMMASTDTAPADEPVTALMGEGGDAVALAVERFGEVAVAVAQSLPPLTAASRIVRAVAVDADGLIAPVLDPAALIDAARGTAGRAETPPARRWRVLVVDDSITTRMLEQSILEGAGYDVVTAASAEEALARAAESTFDLFIVDVEMPGMNGFEFVAATRADARLAVTPAMLVTSRAAEADRRRGLESGARAYVVKGEFDQDVFLSTVRGLVG